MRGSARDLLANEGANSNDSRGAQAMRGGSETECERNDVLLGNGGHQAKYTRAAWERVVWTVGRLRTQSKSPTASIDTIPAHDPATGERQGPLSAPLWLAQTVNLSSLTSTKTGPDTPLTTHSIVQMDG